MQGPIKNRNKYSLDNKNRLIIKRNRKTLLSTGRFSLDRDNRLIYWLNEPYAWRRQNSLPPRISFKGIWKLSSNYDLELNLDKTPQQYGSGSLVIRGEIISTDRDNLVFEIKTYDEKGLCRLQLLKLSGSWQADEYNRLRFLVKKAAAPDILTLEGAWQINQNQQIQYAYEKTNLKTKTKTLHSLSFEGFWQISSSDRLTYILSLSSASRFDFRAQLESPNLYPARGVIKYRIGIGIRGARGYDSKIICLYGNWRFNRKIGLMFQMDYGQNKIQSLEFGTDIYLTNKDEVTFSLTNKRKEPLGICLTFSHKLLKKYGGLSFLRLKGSKKEAGIDAGMRIPF